MRSILMTALLVVALPTGWLGAAENRASGEPVRQSGDATLVDDPAEKARRWKPEWAGFYADENRGADYLLIRVVPRRLELVSYADGLVNDPKTWRPIHHEFH